MQKQIWTIKELLSWTADYFVKSGVDAPRITAELLLGCALRLSRVQLYTNYDKPLSIKELALYKSYIKRRAQGEPTQYITGTQEFWSLNFNVTPDVLIPRADTETLVEAVVNDIRRSCRRDVSMLEIGVGSGIISIAIAHELKDSVSLRIQAVDISQKALNVAKKNAVANGVEGAIEFILGDKFEKVPATNKYDYIVSNPPYLSDEHYNELEVKVKEHEPRIALYGGADGLTFYKEIFSKGDSYLNDKGKIFVEIDFRKKDELEALVDKDRFAKVAYYKDLAGHYRVMEVTLKTGS